jgi:hypothetical protein
MSAIQENPTLTWFGPQFARLHPLLQSLHQDGGILRGQVELKVGKGVAGWLGRRIAYGMRIPAHLMTAGKCDFSLEISHRQQSMYWCRTLGADLRSANNAAAVVGSQFKAVGDFQRGYWIERHGHIRMHLAVELDEQGGWHWRLLRVFCFGLPIPIAVFPRLVAKKSIGSESNYLFEVAFSYPMLGFLFSYSGRLRRAR